MAPDSVSKASTLAPHHLRCSPQDQRYYTNHTILADRHASESEAVMRHASYVMLMMTTACVTKLHSALLARRVNLCITCSSWFYLLLVKLRTNVAPQAHWSLQVPSYLFLPLLSLYTTVCAPGHAGRGRALRRPASAAGLCSAKPCVCYCMKASQTFLEPIL